MVSLDGGQGSPWFWHPPELDQGPERIGKMLEDKADEYAWFNRIKIKHG
jgi:hypothetical protein